MRLYTLDLFRFFAALGVLFYHLTARKGHPDFPLLSQLTQFGFLGVHLFFMISGFVISASANNRNASDFLIARAARLYPAYWFGVIFTALIVIFAENKSLSITTIIANLTLANDYLNIPNVDGVYWTLQAEIKFYALIFLLMLTGIYRYTKTWLTIWLLAAISYQLIQIPSFLPWIINPAYSCFFIAGICFQLIYAKQANPLIYLILAASSILAIIQAYNCTPGFIHNATHTAPVVSSIIVVTFFAAFWLLSTNRLNASSSPLYILLGGLTYPIYLTHNHLGKAIMDSALFSTTPSIGLAVACFAIFATSLTVYKLVEPPLARQIKHLQKWSKSHKK